MDYSFLSPVQDRLVDELELQHSQTIGKKLRVHSRTFEPSLDGVKIAIVGVLESRNSINYVGEEFQFTEIRKAFYKLFPGNWLHEIADLGDIQRGESVEDTYSALIQVVSSLINANIIPIIIGGSQDLTYANYRAQILENQLSGLLLKIQDQEVWVKMIGSFNAYNLLAIYATAKLLGLEQMEALQLLSELDSVAGRFQYFISDTNITAIVDYAHTPDALKNVLATVNDIRTKNENLITVVGAGGDRDSTKRPLMGDIASEMSSTLIITSDNPRSEDPEAIIAQIEKGVSPQHFKKVLTITDRKQAIKTACQLAQPQDIILIAGKGHETYQEINGERHDFDDFKIVKQTLNQLDK